ncbi:MAG: hypothetical protein QM536_05780 [Chitinophagaceae bacterium]|nr:hypothetical protein [Chitinophagaceae bacterium]
MHQNLLLDTEYIHIIEKDFLEVASSLQEASSRIRIQRISEHPIFIVSPTEVNIGILFITQEEAKTSHYYFASRLEEFVERKFIIDTQKFLEIYKNPEEYACLFIINTEKKYKDFIFLPFSTL